MRLRRALRLCFQRALHRLLREEPKKKQKTAAESPGAVPKVTLNDGSLHLARSSPDCGLI